MTKRRENYTTAAKYSSGAPHFAALLDLVFVYGTEAPTVAQIMATTGCSRATAYRIRRSYRDRIDVFRSQINVVARRLKFDHTESAHA